MKKKESVSLPVLVLLIVGLLGSLVLNGVLLMRTTPAVPVLRGTYTSGERALAFDGTGHFCLYTQEGLLEEGNCTEYGEKLYELHSTSGHQASVFLTAEGVCYTGEQGRQAFFARFSENPVLVGNWAEDWDHWPDGPYALPDPS